MLPFTQELAAWQPFFTTLTVVCATLAGLLFVALSLHAGALRRSENINLRRLAQHTFGGFVEILFIGLFFIVPDAPKEFFAVAILFVVGFALLHLIARFIGVFRDQDSSLYRRYFVRRLSLSLLAQILLLAGVVGLWTQGDTVTFGYMTFLFSGSTLLLISTMNNSWYLLAHELGAEK